MKDTSETQRSRRRILLIVIIAFVLSLIPLYIIGMYAHPSVDDYFYGANTSKVWNSTHSIFAVISKAASDTYDRYYEWQGNFAAIFLMCLQPALFGEEFYFLSPFILITAYAACSLFFFYTMLRRVFMTDRFRAVTVAVSVTFVSMQLAHVPSDSFYWYNGSIYYTFFYSLMLLMFALLVIMRSIRGVPLVLAGLACIALSFLIGAGNYATALFTAIILSLSAGAAIYFTLLKRSRTITGIHAVLYALTAVACITGLFISMAAPGNAVRQAAVGGHTGIVRTFIYTFAFGGYSLVNVLSAPCLVFFLCMIPVFYHIAKRTSYRYRCPLLVLIFTFGLYCSAGTPVFYAQGLRIPYRLMNIIYFSAYSFIGFNMIYTLGWIARRFGETPLICSIENACGKIKKSSAKTISALALCICLFTLSCIGRIQVSETEYGSGHAGFSRMPMTVSAVYSLLTGEASVYDNELKMRDEYLTSASEADVAVETLSVFPELLFHTDITTDPDDWRNQLVAGFYHKNSVWLETN